MTAEQHAARVVLMTHAGGPMSRQELGDAIADAIRAAVNDALERAAARYVTESDETEGVQVYRAGILRRIAAELRSERTTAVSQQGIEIAAAGGKTLSKHQFAVMLSELATLRVVCRAKGCGGVMELPIDALAVRPPVLTCPFCRADFDPAQSGSSWVSAFAMATMELRKLKAVVDVEIVADAGP